MREKIAIVCPNMLPVPVSKGGAIETLVEHLINENEKEKKYDFIVYSTYDNKALQISKKYKYSKFIFLKNNKKVLGFNTKLNRKFKKIFGLKIPIIYYEKISRHIAKNDIKKIIVQASFECANYLKDKFYDKDIYLHIHSNDFSIYNDEINRIVMKMSKIICVSEFIKNQAKISGYNIKNFEVVKNCIDVDLFSKKISKAEKDKLKNQYKINDKEKVILFCGRLLPIKGVKELIIAFKKLTLDINCKLLIVGNAGFAESIISEYDKELRELSKDISNKIIFTGFIENKYLPKIHSICDISVIPSIVEEAAGLVVIESMASGIPIIVTDSGGISEYTGSKGVIEIKRDKNLIDNLHKSMKLLLENDRLRNENSIIVKKRAKEFNSKKFYRDFIEILG